MSHGDQACEQGGKGGRYGSDEHRTVMLAEALEALNIRTFGTYIDATFGRGGHSRAILQCLGEEGRLLAIDCDNAALLSRQAEELRRDFRFRLVHSNFGSLQKVAAEAGVACADGIFLDLGVSSPQLDDATRGFSFKVDAPLDMRMNQDQGETAASWLSRVSVNELEEVLKSYGEERYSFKVAKKIVAARHEQSVTTTGQLAALVRSAVRTHEAGKDAATRSFQAIRIHVNAELQQLRQVLPQALALLKPQGRLVVIAFHSLEDRIVKRFMRDAVHPDHLPKRLPLRSSELPQAMLKQIGKPQRASQHEVRSNPRARSAIMRVAEMCAPLSKPGEAGK